MTKAMATATAIVTLMGLTTPEVVPVIEVLAASTIIIWLAEAAVHGR